MQLSNEQRQQIEKLAYRLWEERGKPLGSPDDDWSRAVQEFMQGPDSPSRVPFSSFVTGPVEY